MTDRPTEIFTEGSSIRRSSCIAPAALKAFWRRCPTEFIEPLLPDLDARLGDERDPAELTYMLLQLFVNAEESIEAPWKTSRHKSANLPNFPIRGVGFGRRPFLSLVARRVLP